jgi:hypothetical protein
MKRLIGVICFSLLFLIDACATFHTDNNLILVSDCEPANMFNGKWLMKFDTLPVLKDEDSAKARFVPESPLNKLSEVTKL